MSQTIPPQPVSRKELAAPHRLARMLGIILVGLAGVSLVGWEIWRVTAPPELTIESPAEELLTSAHQIELKGHATPGSALTVNGSVLPLSMEGNFSERLDLRTGANVITITASKRFAKTKIIYRRVVVTE